jgi:7-carboxy-7-deazaguanine synthase
VIGDRNDYDWTKEKISKYKLDEKWTVLFSPVFDKLQLNELADWILADNLDVRLQLQMHKYIWDPDMRAV